MIGLLISILLEQLRWCGFFFHSAVLPGSEFDRTDGVSCACYKVSVCLFRSWRWNVAVCRIEHWIAAGVSIVFHLELAGLPCKRR